MAERNRTKKNRERRGDQDKAPSLRVIPLGGLNEVGMNCCLIESEGQLIMVDCGLTFPESRGFGVDVILPDLSYVLERLETLDAVVLTHGHEDHIGALPFFLREVDVPVYGGRLTLAMVTRKLDEHGLKPSDVRLNPVEPGERVELDAFALEFIHTNHSVPNAMSIAIECAAGRLIFTGDWKIDHSPIEEPPIDLQRFAELGRSGVLAILGDSTNAGTPGYSRSEREVKEGLASVLDSAPGRVLVGQFSSNIHRLQGLLELAAAFGRKVALQGRSMLTNFELASELNFLTIPDDVTIVDISKIDSYPDDELLILSTGSQAEPRAALTRIAHGAHRFKLKPSDTVVLSARVIPGNNVAIAEMIDAMTKSGAKVITASDQPIHATGHARAEEMKLLLNLIRPDYLVPMHGSYHMRRQHADIARAIGACDPVMIEDGDILELSPDRAPKVIGRAQAGRVFVDGRASNDGVDDVQLRDRRQLAFSGIVVVHAVLDRQKGELSAKPELMQRGFLGDENAEAILERASAFAAKAFADLKPELRTSPSQVSDALRIAVRRFFRRELDKKPVVVPLVHEM